MSYQNHLIVAAMSIALLVPARWASAADAAADTGEPAPATATLTDEQAATPAAEEEEASYDDSGWIDNPYLTIEPVPTTYNLATRFGWWGVNTTGSKAMVGEWMGLESSPFFDIDGIFSDGSRTLDFFATGPEGESNMAGLRFYAGPGLDVDMDYRRFIHRLGHDPIGGPRTPNVNGVMPPQGGFYDPPLPVNQLGYVMYGQDFSPGTDYAVRVQQIESKFQGNVTDRLRWHVNVWGQKKEGMRQANSQAHCFPTPAANSNTCHLVSKGQRIDWVTLDVTPGLEARLTDWLTLDYSHTIRSFGQDDDIVTNAFTRGGPYGYGAAGANAVYGYVPENITEIDRVKLHGQLTDFTDLYVFGHLGNTHNEFRDSDRKFYGIDARLTDRSIEGVTFVAYGKSNTQNNSEDTASLNDRYPAQANSWLEQGYYDPPGPPPGFFFNAPPQSVYGLPPAVVGNPQNLYNGLVDRQWFALGTKMNWRPFHDYCDLRRNLAVVSGYEWRQLTRQNVTYDLRNIIPPTYFTQPTTVSHIGFVGLEQDWSCTLSSFARYRVTENNWPLVGATHRSQGPLDNAINTNQPEHMGQVELGSTWSPADNFMLTGSFWIENSYNHSDLIYFDEDNYPFVLTAWYAPTDQWSFTAGYAEFSNWITQDVTLGREDGNAAGELAAWTTPWDYNGRSKVINLAATYAYCATLHLNAGFEYVRGENYFDAPASPPTATTSYADLPSYSAVLVDVYRYSVGFDYALSQYLDSFVRYNYYDYGDELMAYNSGTAHMVLCGVQGVF
jgi:hypothetical protein